MRQRKNPVIISPTIDDSNKKFTSRNPQKNTSSSAPYKVFTICLVSRIINSLLVQTYFNPDEHWQALEVAHRIAFGYGHLTWEWKKGIRSYLHPILFAALYKALAFLRLDSPWFMVRAPRLVQSIFAAVGDLYLHKFSQALFGDNVATWALTNWFMFFCIPRTLSNSLETVLTLVSLYYWPCLRTSSGAVPCGSRKCALVLAAIACAIRPTSAITWIYVGVLELLMTRDKLKFVLLEVIPIGSLLVLLCLKSEASWTIVWVLGTYSLLGHKEFRFVLPVLPVALMFSGYSLANLGKCELSKRKVKESSSSHKKRSLKLQLAVFFLLVTNTPMAIYMSMIHQLKCILSHATSKVAVVCIFPSCVVFTWYFTSQRGTEDVMHYLSNEARENKVKSILFLTPCHATPYYSILHHNIPMRFLDCTPR
ncbi:UNVERIFIED_CONTAM: GPI mannosyltransferase 3 [Sesamum radiatum]|uniref:Mannosyltransferase n=1 Tax=Sesamum radiatum TaxID=300843 RepID=A0AAW2NRS7_SESRA